LHKIIHSTSKCVGRGTWVTATDTGGCREGSVCPVWVLSETRGIIPGAWRIPSQCHSHSCRSSH